MRQTIQPPVLAVSKKQQYEKPTFEVIDLCMESNLLTGSGNPTQIKPITPNPVE